MSDATFVDPAEQGLIDRFLADHYVVVPVENRPGLEWIRDKAAAIAAHHLGDGVPNDPGRYLNDIHRRVTVETLNDMRLAVFNGLNAEPAFRPTYLSLARHAVDVLVGNELVMQRRVNLSVQLPDDSSSLLPVHADVWDGDSAYEVVAWLPLVDCFKTKSMYILPPGPDRAWQARLAEFAEASAEDLYHAIAPDLTFLDVPFGSILLFSQTVMHGNRVNAEGESRWSMNCRVKSLLSPYADKRLGEFFEPVAIRPATRIGAAYRLPEGFDD